MFKSKNLQYSICNNFLFFFFFFRQILCAACNQVYSNDKSKLPRVLYCGHTMCTSCMECRRTNHHTVQCAECPKETRYVSSISKCPVNQSLLKYVEEIKQDEEPNSQQISTIGQESGSDNAPSPTATKSSEQNAIQNGSSKPLDTQQKLTSKSPHSSRCLENGVRPTYFCVTCKQWVCKKCADIDHANKGTCALAPLKDALIDMKKQTEVNAKSISDLLATMLKEHEEFDSQLEMYMMIMRAAFECLGRKQEFVKKSLKDGIQIKKELEGEVLKLPESQSLPEALAQLKATDDKATSIQQWVASEAGRVGNVDKIERSAKVSSSFSICF